MAKAGINLRLFALEDWLRFMKSGASKESNKRLGKHVPIGVVENKTNSLNKKDNEKS